MFQPIPICIKLTHPDADLIQKRDWFTQQPGCQWIIGEMNSRKGVPTLHITRRQVYLAMGEEHLKFHPSMALLRLLNLLHGQSDRFLAATELRQGDHLLDLTLGLATDALVGAWAVGSSGHVTGVEKSPLISAVVRDGLTALASQDIPRVSNPDKHNSWLALKEASHRIQVVWGDHLTYMRTLPNHSVDVIYCDPMFDRTREQSSSIRPLHFWADHGEVTEETLREARRIARRRIAIKVRKGTNLERLGFTLSPGGKYSEVDYGIMEVNPCQPY